MTDFASTPRTVQEALDWLAAVSPAVLVIPLGRGNAVWSGAWCDDEEITRGLVRRLRTHIETHRAASPIPDRSTDALTFEITPVTSLVFLACARPATPLLWLALRHRRERAAMLLRGAVRVPSDHGFLAPTAGSAPRAGLAARRPRQTT